MWLDLAREYAVLAQGMQAAACIRAAMAMAPKSRIVLRSVARFHLHDGDPERAHALLRNAVVTKSDPWLVAAEIATATVVGKTSKLVRPGRSMLESGKFAPVHISELASALAMLELGSGDRGRARKLFRLALEDPTENTVAQVSWAARELRVLNVDPVHLSVPRTFEAQAWASYRGLDWKAAVQAADLWLADEPFASRPAAFGSFVAGTGLGDHSLSAQFANEGLQANPKDVTLLNNLAFALASQGDAAGAASALQRIDPGTVGEEDRIAVLATEGLVKFRSGKPESGRQEYAEAVQLAERLHRRDKRAWAMLYLAREEILARGPDAIPTLAKASDTIKDIQSPQREAAESLLAEFANSAVVVGAGAAIGAPVRSKLPSRTVGPRTLLKQVVAALRRLFHAGRSSGSGSATPT